MDGLVSNIEDEEILRFYFSVVLLLQTPNQLNSLHIHFTKLFFKKKITKWRNKKICHTSSVIISYSSSLSSAGSERAQNASHLSLSSGESLL